MAMALLACACGDRTPAPDRATPPAGPIAVVTLPPPGPAAGAPVPVTVAGDAAQVRIQLIGLDHPPGDLTAELEARDTGEIRRWSVDAGPPDAAGVLAVTVPAYAVGPGVHVLTVWAGDATPLQRYRFEVQVR